MVTGLGERPWALLCEGLRPTTRDVGTAVLEVVFCCSGLACFETSPLVQLLKMLLQPNENDRILLSECMCLELAPGGVAQKWTNISYLAGQAMSLCLLLFFFLQSHAVLKDHVLHCL